MLIIARDFYCFYVQIHLNFVYIFIFDHILCFISLPPTDFGQQWKQLLSIYLDVNLGLMILNGHKKQTKRIKNKSKHYFIFQ